MAAKKKMKPITQPGSQLRKKHKQHKENKPHGHYCYVCGEYKANEKFSGRGHANHMCKACHALPVAARNEMIAVHKVGNMAFRHLSESEIKWLREKMNDDCPEVREAAREAHAFKFPHYERNMIKKGLTIKTLEFFIHGKVWDAYGDEIQVHMRFFADNTGAMRRIDYDASENEQETAIKIKQTQALKFLKAVVHQLNAPFWSEDLSDCIPDDYDEYGYNPFEPYLDVLPECQSGYSADFDGDENFDWALYVDDEYEEPDEESEIEFETDAPADNREPIWSLKL